MQLFCDQDGVLADFDRGYEMAMGEKIEPRHYRTDWPEEKWQALRAACPRFFATLPPMPDMWYLWSHIIRHNPIILTGVPKEFEGEADNQKVEWARSMYGAAQPIICCRSKDKYLAGRPGDVLIDDWEKHRDKWERMGGIWVTHKSAVETVEKLRGLGL
jgi:hypothetical protein